MSAYLFTGGGKRQIAVDHQLSCAADREEGIGAQHDLGEREQRSCEHTGSRPIGAQALHTAHALVAAVRCDRDRVRSDRAHESGTSTPAGPGRARCAWLPARPIVRRERAPWHDPPVGVLANVDDDWRHIDTRLRVVLCCLRQLAQDGTVNCTVNCTVNYPPPPPRTQVSYTQS